MQPPPDALAEFRVVTNNMSAEYGRSGGATINVAYKSGTQPVQRRRVGVLPRHLDERRGLLQVAGGEARAEAQSVRVRRRRADHEEPGVLLHRLRRLPAGPRSGHLFDHRHRGTAAGYLRGRRPQPASPATTYPAGTPIPMTALARRVLARSAGDDERGHGATTIERCSSSRTTPTSTTARSTSRSRRRSRCSAATAIATWTSSTIPPIPLPSGGSGNGQTYVTNKQFATGADLGAIGERRCSRRGSATRTPWRARTRRRWAPPARSRSTASPGSRRDPRVVGRPAQPGRSRATRISGRQATNPQWQYPRVFNPKVNYSWVQGRHSFKSGYEFQHVQTEVQDVNPLYGRDTYGSQISRPAGVAANNALQPRRLRAGLPVAVRAQQHPGGEPPPEHALPLRAGRLAGERHADAEPGPALRVLDAVGRGGQHPVELRSGARGRWYSRATGRWRIARRSIPIATTGGRASASPGRSTRRRSCAAATAWPTFTSIAPAAPTCCRSTARR